jgi:antitoxin component HigA of HigAB toxin-antitoxin module
MEVGKMGKIFINGQEVGNSDECFNPVEHERQVDKSYWAEKEPVDENEQLHLNHEFYKRAAEYREGERIGQIIKGAHKYPEPFNPFSWSPRQLLQHAMQENVDQGHYIYGLYEWLEKLGKEYDILKLEIDNWRKDRNEWKDEAEHAQDEIRKLVKERDEFKKQYIKAHADIQELQYDLKMVGLERENLKEKIGEKNRNIEKLSIIRMNLEKELHELKNGVSDKPPHECAKNQIITWDGHPSHNKIKSIRCRVCDSNLYEA